MADTTVSIALKMRDQASSSIQRAMNQISRSATTAQKSIASFATNIQRAASRATSRIFNLQNAVMGLAGAYGLGRLAQRALDTASSFEMMEVKLEAITKGKGVETLERINKWALDMPVNTAKAVNTFTMMQAMGLDPTIAKMQTLVDTASIFGEETMPRVARALGQMATLGKLSAEELNQLSEAGINARKYLGEFGMTLEQLQKAVAEGKVPISAVIDTIWEGLNRDYGGAAAKAQNAWTGLVATFKSYITEIERTVMGAGVFDALKTHLKTVNEGLKDWLKNNEELIKQKVPIYIEWVESRIKSLWTFLSGISKEVYAGAAGGIIGGMLFGGPGAIILSTLATIDAKTDGLLHKTFNTEMTMGLMGGLLFGGTPGLIVGGLAMIDGYLGGPLLSKAKELTNSAIEYGKILAEIWGPKLADIFENAINTWNTFFIKCEVALMGFKEKHSETFESFTAAISSALEQAKPLWDAFMQTLLALKTNIWPALKPILVAMAKLIGETLLLAIQVVSRAMDGWAILIKQVIIPAIKAIAEPINWIGEKLTWLIDKTATAFGKLRELISFKKDAKLNIELTGSGSSTLPIMEKIAEIKKGLNSLSGMGNYRVAIDYPTMPTIRDPGKQILSEQVTAFTGGSSGLLQQYKDIEKALYAYAETQREIFDKQETAMLKYAYSQASYGLESGGTSLSSVTPAALGGAGRRYAELIKELKERYLEPLQKAMAESGKSMAESFTRQLKRGVQGMRQDISNISSFSMPAMFQPSYAGIPQDISTMPAPTPDFFIPSVFKPSYARPVPQDTPVFPKRNIPSIIINTGDLNVRAAADDPEAVKAIDEKLAELIRSGRSRIPSIFRHHFF